MKAPLPRAYLMIECVVLMIGIPTALVLTHNTKWMLAVLWLAAGACALFLRQDKNFNRTQLWHKKAITRQTFGPILLFFLVPGVFWISILANIYAPDRVLGLVRARPEIWALIMVAYPILSVYPQEIIYRAFFFHRYEPLFGQNKTMIALSAVAFSFAHIIFFNRLAPILALAGGLLFGITYQRHKSLLLVSIEHALYGCFVFTIGLGWYFYGAAMR